MRRLLVSVLVLGLVLFSQLTVAQADPAGRIKIRGLNFLLAHQNQDGGFPLRPGGPSEAETTAWSAANLGLTGAEAKALDQALRYLDLAQSRDGGVNNNSAQTAFWTMAQTVSRGPVQAVQEACRWLLRAQRPEGGFGREKGQGPAQTTSTAAALEGLLAAGMSPQSAAVESGLDWLHGAQNRDGGWPLEPGGPSLALSTAWVLKIFGRLKCFPESCGFGVGWLIKCRDQNGGFGIVPRAPTDPELTAYAALALRSLEGPEEVIAAALKNLAQVQEEDGGFVSHVPREFNGRDYKNLQTTSFAIQASLERD